MKHTNVKFIGSMAFISVVFAFIISGCQIQTKPAPSLTNLPPRTPSIAVTAAIKDSIFGNSVCSLPCWEGIIPGVTSKDDSLRVLQKLTFVEQASLYSRNFLDDPGTVKWDWKGSIPSYEEHQRMSWNKATINEVVLFSSNMSVEEMINHYGLPEKVRLVNIGTPENIEYGVSLYYAQRGFEIQINKIYEAPDAQLRPSNLITYIVLFEPMSIEEYLTSRGIDFSNMNLRDWGGYGNLDNLYSP